MIPESMGQKLQDLMRRSPEGYRAFEILIDTYLARLGPEEKPYVWKCDEAVVNPQRTRLMKDVRAHVKKRGAR